MQLHFKKWLVAEDSVGPLFSKAGAALAQDTAEKLVPIINRQVSGPVAQAAQQGANKGTTAALMANNAATKTPVAMQTPRDVSGITNAQQAKAFNPNAQTAPNQGNIPQQDTNLAAALEKGIVKGFQTVLGK